MKWSCNLFLAQNDYGVMNHQRFHYRYFSVELELFFLLEDWEFLLTCNMYYGATVGASAAGDQKL